MEKLKNRKLIFAALILIALGFWGFRTFINSRNQQPQYQTAKVERGNIVYSIAVSGQILNSNFVKITTQASGVVGKVVVSDGDQVFAGQTIAEINLDPEGLQKNAKAWASYLSAKSSLTAAQAKLNSLQSALFKNNQKLINDAVARGLKTDDPTYIQQSADWLQAEADYKNQQAVIAASQASQSSAWFDYLHLSSTITAPKEGKIGNLAIVEGINISGDTAQLVGVIYSENKPIASFNLSEIDVAKVKTGQKATITLDGIPGKTFTGEVQSVNKIGMISSGVTNYPILVRFDVESEEVLPNMAATASILLDNKSGVLVVPTSAITTQDGQSQIQVLRNGQPQQVQIETGLSSDTQTEIKSGLQEGDEVITGTASGSSNITRSGTSPFNTFGARGFGVRTGGGGGMQH